MGSEGAPASTDQHTCNTLPHLWYAPEDFAWGYSQAFLKSTVQEYAQTVRSSLTTGFYQNRDQNMRAVDQNTAPAVVICSPNVLRVRHCVLRAFEYAQAISISLIPTALKSWSYKPVHLNISRSARRRATHL